VCTIPLPLPGLEDVDDTSWSFPGIHGSNVVKSTTTFADSFRKPSPSHASYAYNYNTYIYIYIQVIYNTYSSYSAHCFVQVGNVVGPLPQAKVPSLRAAGALDCVMRTSQPHSCNSASRCNFLLEQWQSTPFGGSRKIVCLSSDLCLSDNSVKSNIWSESTRKHFGHSFAYFSLC
jgi:hypothetical protein